MSSLQNLPSCYFNPDRLTESVLNIRRCIAAGVKAWEVTDEILLRYEEGPGEKICDYLKRLFVAIYDFENPQPAPSAENPPKSGFPFTLELDRPVSYQVLKQSFEKDQRFKWLTDYSEKLLVNPTISRGCYNPRITMVVSRKEKGNVITLCKDAQLYCIIEKDLTVNLVIMVEADYKTTIYEESCNGEVPTYLGVEGKESFTSPVFKVKVAKKILEYCLCRVGYTYVSINMKVVFTSPKMIIQNLDDYRYNPQYSKYWEGVDVRLYQDIDPEKGLMIPCPYNNLILAARDIYDREMLRMLYASLSATSKIYHLMSQGSDQNLMLNSTEDLDRWARKLGIFKSRRK